jgi:hypothetical protein
MDRRLTHLVEWYCCRVVLYEACVGKLYCQCVMTSRFPCTGNFEFTYVAHTSLPLKFLTQHSSSETKTPLYLGIELNLRYG